MSSPRPESEIDEAILSVLRAYNKPLSTYKIALETKSAKCTIHVHCSNLAEREEIKKAKEGKWVLKDV